MAAAHQLAEQDLVGQRLLDVFLDDPGQGTGAVELVIAVLGQPVGGFFREFNRDMTIRQLGFQLHDELLHHAADDVGRQGLEGDDGVQTVAEFRREQAVDRRLVRIGHPAPAKAYPGLVIVRRPGIGGHDQDHVPEIDLLAVGIGQGAVIHHLQEDVVDILVRLFDFIEQDDRVLVLIDGVGQLAALVMADIARRRADQAADRMTLHIFAHVEAQKLDAQGRGELARRLGLAHAGRAGEEEGADGLLRIAQTGPAHLHGRGELFQSVVLTIDGPLEVRL